MFTVIWDVNFYKLQNFAIKIIFFFILIEFQWGWTETAWYARFFWQYNMYIVLNTECIELRSFIFKSRLHWV